MVNERAQLYTMEGIAAGLIMLLTAYLVLGSTSVYTPGDTHITDMQLEQVGSDILRVMDTPRTLTGSLQPARSDLELIVNTTDSLSFNNNFTSTYLCNSNAVAKDINVGCTGYQTNAFVWYHGNSLGSYLLWSPSPNLLNLSRTEPGVMVTHWVHTNYPPKNIPPGNSLNPEPQELLMEVVLWKA
ncbi:MAG: hypothetical protein LUQ32_03470 [Methanomicrobiales archaeon]|nr:hypothetical protein [Methanomicrobiales archaeon]